MEKRVLGIAAAALLVAVSAVPVLAQEAVAPEYKWVKGETARYKMTIEKHQKATGAQQLELTHSRWYLWTQQVTDVAADGAATVEMKFESAGVRLQIPSAQLDFTYDPANPDDEKRKTTALAMPYTSIVGESLTYKVSKKGKILGVVGFDKLGTKVLDNVKAAPKGASYVLLAQDSLQDLLDMQMEGIFRLLPEKPVNPGTLYKKAKIREPNPAVGSLILQTDYTMVGPEALNGDDSYKFTYTTTKTPETPGPAAGAAAAAAPPAPTGGAKLTEAKGSGEFFLSKSKGIVTKNTFGFIDTLETPVPAAPDAAPGAAPGSVSQRDEIKVVVELAPADAGSAPPAAAAPAAGQPK
jgi:hypothetical protein